MQFLENPQKYQELNPENISTHTLNRMFKVTNREEKSKAWENLTHCRGSNTIGSGHISNIKVGTDGEMVKKVLSQKILP